MRLPFTFLFLMGAVLVATPFAAQAQEKVKVAT
jgi:hypothetical protein